MSCFRMDIVNFLRQQGSRPIKGFQDDDGHAMPDAVVREFLADELRLGHKFMPMCDHDNFDYEIGWCRGEKPGHRVVDEEETL